MINNKISFFWNLLNTHCYTRSNMSYHDKHKNWICKKYVRYSIGTLRFEYTLSIKLETNCYFEFSNLHKNWYSIDTLGIITGSYCSKMPNSISSIENFWNYTIFPISVMLNLPSWNDHNLCSTNFRKMLHVPIDSE